MFSALRASPPASCAIRARDVVRHLGAELGRAARDHLQQLVLVERLERVDLRAREQRRVHLEVRVLGRRADQRDEPLLDRGQQRVLLRLVEAVDLVEEEDRALPVRAEPLARPRRAPRAPCDTVADTADSSSNAAPVMRATMRASVVLPLPGGP